MKTFSKKIVVFAGVAAVAGLVLLSGCGSGPKGHRPPERELNEVWHPPAVYQGEGYFFEGLVKAQVSIAQGFGAAGGGPGGGAGGAPGGGGGRGGHGGGPGGPGGDGGGGFESRGGARIGESQLPPLSLRLTLENQSKETVTVAIWEFKSELGDFAVRPEKLVIAAGATLEVDPMTSRIPVVAGEVPVSVRLKMAGRDETQVVKARLCTQTGEQAGARKP